MGFPTTQRQLDSFSSGRGVAVTPGSTTFLPTKGLYVGTAGDLEVVGSEDGETFLIPNAPVGYHPLHVIAVLDGNTTASDIVALY